VRYLALLCLWTPLLPGCSLLTMKPVAHAEPTGTYPQCSEGVAPVLVDIAAAGAMGIWTAKISTGTQRVVPGVLTVVLLGSAVYGMVLGERCRSARAKASEAIPPPPYQPVPDGSRGSVPRPNGSPRLHGPSWRESTGRIRFAPGA
jgi:hypothetical protein